MMMGPEQKIVMLRETVVHKITKPDELVLHAFVAMHSSANICLLQETQRRLDGYDKNDDYLPKFMPIFVKVYASPSQKKVQYDC